MRSAGILYESASTPKEDDVGQSERLKYPNDKCLANDSLAIKAGDLSFKLHGTETINASFSSRFISTAINLSTSSSSTSASMGPRLKGRGRLYIL